MCEIDNAKGGVKVGNEYYKMQPITYSTDNDVNKGVAAVNRLVFQDKVKFIISHGVAATTFVPLPSRRKSSPTPCPLSGTPASG